MNDLWQNALDKPDKPGLWDMLEEGKESVRIEVSVTNSPTLWWRLYDAEKHNGWRVDSPPARYLPVVLPPIPPAPKVSKWDYEPKDGDWVVMSDDANFPRVLYRVIKIFINGTTIKSWQERGYRFAKVEVGPIPGVDE